MISPYKTKDLADAKAAPAAARRTKIFLWTFSIIMIVTAGTAFIFKLIEFIYTAVNTGTESLASFLIPVLTYLIVAAGFACLFIWAYLSGHFKDVEGPKYRMLEMQDQIDRGEIN